jgi:3-methyladenine DNA glycosylase AlkD
VLERGRRVGATGRPEGLAGDVIDELWSSSNVERAHNEKRYLKSDRVHIGCGMKFVDAEVRKLRRLHLSHAAHISLIEQMWDSDIFEACMVVAKLADKDAATFGPEDLYIFEQMLRESQGWALVDALSTGVISEIVARDPAATASTLDRWAANRDFWVRRASMLSLLRPLKRGGGQWDRFTRYADAMLDEKEFFIRKAIGWVLRETSKERPQLVFDWLLPRARRASGVTFREAVKYLDETQRTQLLACRE